MQSEETLVGRVLRASTMSYACGTRSQELNTPSFGAFVQTSHSNGNGDVDVIGLIYAIHIDDDPWVRQLIRTNQINVTPLRDQRENRRVPVKISIENIGFRMQGEYYHNLPPRPPMSLDPVYICDDECIYNFTQKFDFFRLVLNTSEGPAEELIATPLNNAANARPILDQPAFLFHTDRPLPQLFPHH